MPYFENVRIYFGRAEINEVLNRLMYIEKNRGIMMADRRISEWFHLYSNDIYQYLIYLLGTGDVEDLVQEVFIRAIKSIDRFNEQSSPKTWLYSIARYAGIDEIRKRKRRHLLQTILNKGQSAENLNTPENLYFMNEDQKELYSAITSLKQNYRDVIVLRGIKELSVKETAEVLKWSEAKVSLTFHRAILALRKEQGGSEHAEK